MASTALASVSHVGSVHKAALVLRVIATFGPRGAALGDVSAGSGLPKATVHRILAALASENLIERPDGTRLYRLGREFFAFGTGLAEVFDFRDLASESLRRFSDETGELSLLGIHSGFDGLCLDRHEGVHTPKDIPIQLLDRWPLGVGVFSLPLLAFLSDGEVDHILEHNRRRLHNEPHFAPKLIRAGLKMVRRRGFAYLCFPPLPNSQPKTGVAVPVFDRRRRVVASLCSIATASRLAGTRLDALLAALQREAGAISALHAEREEASADRETWRIALGNGIEKWAPD